ncbi:hypothetical protein [Leifsonia sp. RAF41]|uniref:hypothetical protein n=1 Tax=Leifsonia sp. RAF41 TaxID=3233056 RepID=UPI003F966EEB
MKINLHPTTTDRLLLGGTVGAVAIVDAAGILLTSWILWSTAGATVVSGTVFGQVVFLLVALIWVAARTLLIRRTSRSIAAPQRLRVIVTAVEIGGIAALLTLWIATGLYYVGWVLTLATLTLLLGSALRLLITVVRPQSADDQDETGSQTSVLRSARTQAVMPAIAAAVGIVVVFLTASVHGLDPTILGGLILLTAFGALAGTATGYALDRTPARKVGKHRPASL